MCTKIFALESYQEINVEFVVEEQVKHIHSSSGKIMNNNNLKVNLYITFIAI